MKDKLKLKRDAMPIWEKKWCVECANRICDEIDSNYDYYLSEYFHKFTEKIIKNIEYKWNEIEKKESNEYKDWYLRAWDIINNQAG
jgi:hypothetical protein